MSRLLVTGATGFIGRATLPLLKVDWPAEDIVCAGRSGGVGAWPLDLSAPWLDLPAGITTVLHLAGEKRDEAQMAEVNELGAARLVEAAARVGAKRFVHLSSVGVYGAGSRAAQVNEASPHTPRNRYEQTKEAGERAVIRRCAELGLDCVVLQPSNVVGIVPGRNYPLLGLTRMVARGWMRQIGRGEAWVNYVAVEDVAAALVAAIRPGGARGVFIVNTPVALASLLGWMADSLEVPAPVGRIPQWLAVIAAGAGGATRWLLRRELPLSPERYRELTNTTRYDGSALSLSFPGAYALGIEAAMRNMVQRYRSEGLV